jgi:methanogenic corrinoid protein MtbC1
MKRWIKDAKKMYQRGFFDENPKSGLKLIATIEQLEKVTTILRNLYNEKSLLLKEYIMENKQLQACREADANSMYEQIQYQKKLETEIKQLKQDLEAK